MSLRKITTGFDETIRVGGIGAALFFVMIELTYINSKSLYNLDSDKWLLSWLLAIIGALAYSIVTITVMRHPGHLGLKRIFPVFDTILVFCGYNLELIAQIENETVNYVRVALSIFISVFTGLITYSLGMLNYEQSGSAMRDEEIEALKSEIQKRITEIENLQSQFAKLQSDLLEKQSQIEQYTSQLAKQQSEFANLQSQFTKTESELHKYKSEFIKSELSRIRKKKRNRTEAETRFLEEHGEAA